MEKKKSIILIVGMIIILGIIGGIIKSCTAPKWEVNYHIINYVNGNTFAVEGEIELKRYEKEYDKGDLFVLTADAVDTTGRKTRIFTTIKFNGDGIYKIYMDSYYHYDAEIVKIENFVLDKFL